MKDLPMSLKRKETMRGDPDRRVREMNWDEFEAQLSPSACGGSHELYRGSVERPFVLPVRGGNRPARGEWHHFDDACATSRTLTSKKSVLPASGWLKSRTTVSFFTSEIRGKTFRPSGVVPSSCVPT